MEWHECFYYWDRANGNFHLPEETIWLQPLQMQAIKGPGLHVNPGPTLFHRHLAHPWLNESPVQPLPWAPARPERRRSLDETIPGLMAS